MTSQDFKPSSGPALRCPKCGEDVWDLPYASKLAKCWNIHENGGTLAFDTMSDDDEDEERPRSLPFLNG